MAKIVVVGGFAESLINFRGPLITAMVQAGHEVIACAPDASQEIRRRLVKECGARYEQIPIDRTAMNPFKDIRTLYSIFVLLRRERPDVFLAYTIKPVVFGSLAARMANVSHCFSMITGLGYAFVNTAKDGGLLRKIICFLYRTALKGNTRVFFQNPDDRDVFLELSLLKSREQAMIVNGSGVDVKHFRPVPLLPDISFLLIARLLKDKGVYEYIQAARLLKQSCPEIEFHLVGWFDSNPAAIHEEEVQSWVQEGIISFWGKLDDVRPAIAKGSVYVLPSYREGTPRTVLEAMAMGRAVITTDTAGCRETVQDGVNGFLVPVANIEALVMAMERFIQEPTLIERMGQAGRVIAEERYDVRKVNRIIMRTMEL